MKIEKSKEQIRTQIIGTVIELVSFYIILGIAAYCFIHVNGNRFSRDIIKAWTAGTYLLGIVALGLSKHVFYDCIKKKEIGLTACLKDGAITLFGVKILEFIICMPIMLLLGIKNLKIIIVIVGIVEVFFLIFFVYGDNGLVNQTPEQKAAFEKQRQEIMEEHERKKMAKKNK